MLQLYINKLYTFFSLQFHLLYASQEIERNF